MPTRDEYKTTLDRLFVLLQVKPLTAQQIARRMRCGKLTAYRRVQALRAQGVKVAEHDVRQGKTGPKARAFSVLP